MEKDSGQKTRFNESVQLSLFDDLIADLQKDGAAISSSEITEVIKKLITARDDVEKREEKERRRREKEEAERKAEKERMRKEAHIQEVTCMDLPLDWENAFAGDARTQGVHVDSVSDALVLSLTTLGKVDIEYIAAVTSLEYKEVIGALRGSIYQNPQTWDECFYKGWETADEYLSGNLMRKWQAARDANEKYKGYFADNLKAIEAVLPPTVATKDIYVTLGSPWVPTDIIDDFIEHLFKRKCEYWYRGEDVYAVKHDEITGTWEIPYKTRYGHGVTDTKTYGTDRIEALYILERTLNMKSVAVTDEWRV